MKKLLSAKHCYPCNPISKKSNILFRYRSVGKTCQNYPNHTNIRIPPLHIPDHFDP